MKHKEKLEYWKKNDPIHYYEMTTDPTGVGNSDSGIIEVIATILAIGGVILCFLLLVN